MAAIFYSTDLVVAPISSRVDLRSRPFFCNKTQARPAMGVPGLWEVLRPVGRATSLEELAVGRIRETATGHVKPYRIGIDISIWFYHTQKSGPGENHELRLIFFRFCRLLKIPCRPVIVFDGPNRPLAKRGVKRPKKRHWLEIGTKRLAEAFGFHWIEAPGEAEAELAYLNRVGAIDAILSEDVDAFLFGAKVVLRSMGHTKKGGDVFPVVEYRDCDIAAEPISLTRSHLILIVLLVGGDYDQNPPEKGSRRRRCDGGKGVTCEQGGRIGNGSWR